MVHKGIEGHDSWYEIEFLSRSVREEDFWVSLLRVDDFPGSRLVKGETTYTEVVRQITYREVVEDFIPRFWSNLCYLGRLPCKSSGGPLPYRITQRKHCTLKYVGRLFIDRVGIIDGLNPQHIKDAMKNMFGMTLDYTTLYRALLYAQELIADTMSVQQIDGWQFFVKGGKKDGVVDLEHRKCDCGVYGVEKIPCSHAIAAGSYAGLHISTLVCPVYSKDTLFAGNSENIYPCAGQQVEARTCFPSEVKRGPGRQKKSRWQSWLELSRMRGRTPRKQHRVYRCSVCKETGHTRPHCKN
ncbi:hypothetical protein F2Q68_00021470 [Brassica cretica]|uniref:SWIM-type domain-containing protein n=1 Tax=Brassica cretica TaxID=69181 RepID=A0A8S9FYG2_BRACR|nr:hypothetical protein F2Q68_00021470 [Brassica cretica]